MCGICGVFDPQARSLIDEQHLLAMRDTMFHRGPDDAGHYLDPDRGIYLGHRRLSIIDLSASGRQPMTNEDGELLIVFNGEIYNYLKLRPELENKGHQFKSDTDTEVLIHLYEEKGVDFLKEVQGMFALAIWDASLGRVILARDRLGIKPLYFYFLNGILTFGSEIKSLLEAGGFVDRSLNNDAIRAYFKYHYIPYPLTIFKHIYKLEPGHCIIVDHHGLKKEKYWDLSLTMGPKDERKAVEQHRELFIHTVKSHLISDVPLGAFLSGGVDSTAVVQAMSENSTTPINTFTIGFERASNLMDIQLSRLASESLGTNHHEYIMTPDITELFEKVLYYFDEPFGITSALPIYLNAEFAKKSVTVVLTGDGADELYAGYNRYVLDKLIRIIGFIPQGMKEVMLKNALRMLARFSVASKVGKVRDQILKRILMAIQNRDPLQSYLSLFSGANNDYPASIFTPGFYSQDYRERADFVIDSEYFGVKDIDHLNSLLYFDIKTSLVDEMLTKVDRMTMAHGIEARVPFLDHRLVEYVFSLRNTLKLKGFTRKYLLKKTFSQKMPKEILSAPKRGFNLPIDQWLRNELREQMELILNPVYLKNADFLNTKMIDDLKQRHLSGRGNFGLQLWSIMVFFKMD